MKQLTGIIILTVTLIFAGCISLKRVPRNAYINAKNHNVVFDAIIVPGIPFEKQAWDSVMKARVIWAYILYKNGMTKNIIFSGDAVYSPYYESKTMGLYAMALGIPKKHIFYDTLAHHSTENVYYSYLVAKAHGFKVVALTTDPIQSALLRKFTAIRFGTQIYHMPFVIDSLKKYNYLDPVINPEPARKRSYTSSINTEESRITRLFGTLGGDIDFKQYPHKKLPSL